MIEVHDGTIIFISERSDEIIFMKDYKKYYTIAASPEEIYIALTNPATIQLWTGEKAEMSTIPGSEFSLWDESIVGQNIEFVERKK